MRRIKLENLQRAKTILLSQDSPHPPLSPLPCPYPPPKEEDEENKFVISKTEATLSPVNRRGTRANNV